MTSASLDLDPHDPDALQARFALIGDVLARWADGQDTWWIGQAVRLSEADVCRIIVADRERRHKARPRP